MAKDKVAVPNILSAVNELKKNNLLPVYYFFGEDTYSIEAVIKEIEKSASQFITSDFDKETFYGDDRSLSDILNLALTFPFGSEKKLIICKEFEKIKDKKPLSRFAEAPPEFSIIIFYHNGSISNLRSEPYTTLLSKKFLFEAKELKGNNLVEWLISFAASRGKNLTRENAQFLIDISGENRAALEAQLEKMFTFLGENKDITLDVIKALSTSLKEYNIFDLQNAIGKKNKAAAIKIAFNLLENGSDPVFIVAMLTRYFTGLSRIRELNSIADMTEQTAARIVGTHPYYYKDHQSARKIYSEKNMADAVKALLKADVTIKTTSVDDKTLISMLIAEIIGSDS